MKYQYLLLICFCIFSIYPSKTINFEAQIKYLQQQTASLKEELQEAFIGAQGKDQSIESQSSETELVKVEDNTNTYVDVNDYVMIRKSSEGGKLTAKLQYIHLKDSFKTRENKIIKDLVLEIIEDSNSELNIRIFDANNERFVLPQKFPFPYTKQGPQMFPKKLYHYETSLVGERFYFRIIRTATKEPIFDTQNQPFIFSDKFIQFSTSLTSDYLYGMGERRQDFKFKAGNYTFWNRDHPAGIETGVPNSQEYGFHPMYLRKEAQTNFHVFFFRTTNAFQFTYEKDRALFRSVGGIIDLKLFLSDSSAETAVQQYHNYIGGYTLHPFWAQGFHQCKWGYRNSRQLEKVLEQYNLHQLPLDALWTDIDYMHKFHDFTIETKRYDLETMSRIYNTSGNGVHWVPIIDVGISINQEANLKGKELDIFIKSSITDQDLVGVVWPGRTNFPDFNNPKTKTFWNEGLSNITKNYPGLPQYSGLWIDMNEFSNFVNGEIVLDPRKIIHNIISDSYKNLPFDPNGAEKLGQRTISLNAYHYNQPDSELLYIPNQTKVFQYDMHNLNGYGEGYATHYSLKQQKFDLTFILSRSTLFGSGQFVQHWTGDNKSTWEMLRLSVAEIFNFNLFGIPMVGSDICGFEGDTTPELCARWMQVGAFYPFSRNHNSIFMKPQEPYVFRDYPFVLQSSLTSLQIRYSLLKYYYTLFVKNDGKGTVFRPLFFEFPEQANLYEIDSQFMLGSEIMIAPVLVQSNTEDNSTSIDIVFPEATWYDFYTGAKVQGAQQTIQVPFSSPVPMFIREGKGVLKQNSHRVLRSRNLDNKFTLIAALNSQGLATAQIMSIDQYTDENIIQKCVNNNCIIQITLELQGQNIIIGYKGMSPSTLFEKIIINEIVIYSESIININLRKNIVIEGEGSTTVSINQVEYE